MKYTLLSFALAGLCAFLTFDEAEADVIAAWHFDESSGSTAFAAVGSVDGSLMGDANFAVGGVSGGAVNLSTAGNGFVDMGNNFGFDGNSTFSLVTWVQLAGGDSNGYLIAGRHQATVVAGYFNGINNTGSSSGELTGGGIFYQAYPNPVSVDLGINDGDWHQIVGVHDFAGNQARLYIDGVLRNTQLYDPFALSAANFAVGGLLNAAGTQMVSSLSGTVDEVSIWSQALTDMEVKYLFDNPGTLSVPEPSSLLLLTSVVLLTSLRRRRSLG